MKLFARFGLGFALTVVVLVSCSSNDAPPPPATGGNAGSSQNVAGDRSGSGDAGSDSAAARGGADSQAEGGAGSYMPPFGSIGGQFPEAEGGAPPNPAPSCDLGATWGNPVALAGLSTAQADERLLGMTPDERSLVFSRGAQLFVADRDDATKAFGATVAVALPSPYTFEHGLALSADGLTLVVVRQDQLAFAEVTRSGRGKTFDGAPSTARFGLVNGVVTMSGDVSWPVLSADGKQLLLTRLEGVDQSGFRIYGDAFDQSQLLDPVTFGAVEGKHKLSLSLSADARTLFFFDEDVGHAAALGSATPRAAYTERMELPGLLGAFSSAGCERLYGTLEQGGSLDLVVETAN